MKAILADGQESDLVQGWQEMPIGGFQKLYWKDIVGDSIGWPDSRG